MRKSQSNKAMDHLDGANYRDYGTEPKRNRRSEIQSGSDEPREAAKEGRGREERPPRTAS